MNANSVFATTKEVEQKHPVLVHLQSIKRKKVSDDTFNRLKERRCPMTPSIEKDMQC